MSLTIADIVSAWTTRSAAFDRDPWQYRILQLSSFLGIVAVLLLALIAWFALVPADRASRSNVRPRVVFSVTAVVFVILAVLGSRIGMARTEGAVTPGPISAEMQPSYGNASPLPPLPTFAEADRWTALHAPPMKTFFTVLIAALVFALVLIAPSIVARVRPTVSRE